MALLETHQLTKRFGGLVALDNLDFAVETGEVRGVIGPNGSGKSTLFNVISGIYPLDSGTMYFEGEEFSGEEAHQIAARGLARTFQLLRIWPEMSVLDNVMVGHHCHLGYGTWEALLATRKMRNRERQLRVEMEEILELVGLVEFAGMPAAETSVGQRRLLTLARAIAMRPKVLMLDEPAAGLSPVNVEIFMDTILKVKERFGLTLVLVEHILRVVMDTCKKVTVLDHGKKIAEGTPDEVKDNHDVIEAYLGKEMSDEQLREMFRS